MTTHVEDRLSAYLDGELTVVDAAAVRQHLLDCAACAGRLRELQAVDRAFAGLPASAPPGYFDAFAARVRGRIEAASPRRPGLRLPVWTWAMAAALLLAVLLPRLPWDDLRPRSEPAPLPPPAASSPAPGVVAEAPPTAEEGRGARPPLPPGPKRKTDATGPRPAAAAPPPAGSWALPPADAPEAPRKRRRPEAEADTSAPALAARDVAVAGKQAPGEARGLPSAPGLEKAERHSATPPPAPEGRAAGPGRMAATAEAKRPRAELRAAAAPVDAEEAEFAALAARRAESPPERRVLRDDWRAFARRHPGPRADEARVRAVELGVEIARSSGEAADADEARREGRDYMARDDAAQRDRVMALLAALPR